MRRLNLETKKPSDANVEDWVRDQFEAINDASLEEDAKAAAEPFVFDYAAVTETLTFDPATANLADVRNVLSTFLMYLQRGGPSKTQ